MFVHLLSCLYFAFFSHCYGLRHVKLFIKRIRMNEWIFASVTWPASYSQKLNSVGAGRSWDPTRLVWAPTRHSQAPTRPATATLTSVSRLWYSTTPVRYCKLSKCVGLYSAQPDWNVLISCPIPARTGLAGSGLQVAGLWRPPVRTPFNSSACSRLPYR